MTNLKNWEEVFEALVKMRDYQKEDSPFPTIKMGRMKYESLIDAFIADRYERLALGKQGELFRGNQS